MEEQWKEIEGFPRYQVSSEGRIYNKATNRYMATSTNQYGAPKISLMTESGGRHDRSVATLIANAFVEKEHPLCDRVLFLNGDRSDLRAENLAWRPRWFVWKYTHQLNVPQPAWHRNLPVVNQDTGARYENIIEAGKAEGLLFEQIWHSTYSGGPVYPTGHHWVVDENLE